LRLLVKLGGTLLDDAECRVAVARELIEASRESELAVVHGGGKQVTRFLEERGIETRFCGGLRVSDERVIDAVTKVIAGGVNKQLVSAIIGAGRAAVGLSGVDGPLTTAVQLDPELGFVGRPVKSDGRLLELLTSAGYLPVVACIAGDEKGNIFNVNADQMAVSCAVGWHADKLFFLTDVPGVKDRSGEVIPHLTSGAARDLVGSGVAHGGMQAKLEAAISALSSGVPEVAIAQGREVNICAQLLKGEAIGTRLTLNAGRVST
jgi:acetylglutamate kinase